jgi:hypothetical protein
MKKNIFTIAGILSILAGNAQVSSLNFNQQTGVFTPVSGIPSATITNHSVMDDYVSNNKIPIPFPFTYAGQLQDSLCISENGFIWFGNNDPAMSFEYKPVSNAQDPSITGIISVLGGDLEPHKHAGLPTTIKSAVMGTAPSRTFVIEYLNTSRFENTIAGDTLDFQILLHENGNKVQFTYGRFGLRQNVFSSMEVGLKGQTYSDFNIRKVALGSWNNSVVGPTQTAKCLLNQNTKPVNGQEYSWYQSVSGITSYQPDIEVLLYPNPVKEFLTIHLKNENYKKATFAITTMSGWDVKTGEINHQRIDVEDLPQGIYILTITVDGERLRKTLIKE